MLLALGAVHKRILHIVIIDDLSIFIEFSLEELPLISIFLTKSKIYNNFDSKIFPLSSHYCMHRL